MRGGNDESIDRVVVKQLAEIADQSRLGSVDSMDCLRRSLAYTLVDITERHNLGVGPLG